jgi:hypothetical protein
VSLTAPEGIAPAPAQLTLTNNSGANWTASVTYPGPSGWLTVTPAAAATQGAQQVSLNASALNAPGTYTATVQIVAGNRTRNIPVTYTVTPNIVPDFGASQSSVTLSAVTGQTAAPAGVNLNITAARATTFTTSISYAQGASNWLGVTGNAAPGTLALVPQTVALAPGSYQATVTLSPNIGTQVTVPVTYTLAPSTLTFTPANPLFTIDRASTATAQFLQRSVVTGDTGAPLTWTASSSVPWLNVTPAGASGQNAVLTLVPSALESMRNGPHQASLVFSYNGPSVVNATRTLTVDLSLSLPTIEYAMPHVAYLNEQKQLVLRGSGFDQPGGAAVTFDGTAAATVEVLSDTELRVTPPASEVAAVSRPLLAIANALNLDRSDVDLVVRAKPAYGTTQVDNGDIWLSTGWRVVYDAERDLVFGSRAFSSDEPFSTIDSVLRFALDPTGTAPPTFTFKKYQSLNDIALSADGRTLYVLAAHELHFVDPATMNDIKPPTPVPGSGIAGRMAVLNDGRILMPWIGRLYFAQTDQFEIVGDGQQRTEGLMEVSADGSRVALYTPTGLGGFRLGTFDASTNEFHFMSNERGTEVLSLDRTGTRIAAGPDLFNADLTPYGMAGPPGTANFSRLSPAGDRLYSLDFSSPTKVRVHDTSAPAASFPELTPVNVPFDASSMGISLNGEHVFIISKGTFFVVEP